MTKSISTSSLPSLSESLNDNFFHDSFKGEIADLIKSREKKERIMAEYDRVITALKDLHANRLQDDPLIDELMESLIGSTNMVKAISFELYDIYQDCLGHKGSQLMNKDFLMNYLKFTDEQAEEVIHNDVTFVGAICESLKSGFTRDILQWKTDLEVDEPPNYVYLRFGVGSFNENSPGHRYVVEIWPPGHSSPIHSHGHCDGVVWSLIGSLDTEFYYSLGHNTRHTHTLRVSQHTGERFQWMTANLNQTHRVINHSLSDPAISLHAYDGDSDHFDFLTADPYNPEYVMFFPKCDFCEWPPAKKYVAGRDIDFSLLYIRTVLLEAIGVPAPFKRNYP